MQRLERRRIVLVAVVAASVTLCATQSSSFAATPTHSGMSSPTRTDPDARGLPPTDAAVGSPTSTGDDIDEAAADMDAFGRSSSGDSTYGGVVVTDGESHIDVYLTSLTPDVELPYQSLDSTPSTMDFLKTEKTLVALNQFHDEVTASYDRLTNEGITLAAWYPVTQTGRETLQVVSVSNDQIQTLNSEFGSTNIDVIAITPNQLPDVTANRLDDSAVRSGGANTDDLNNGGCTSGFPAMYDGHDAMLSASHCYASDPAGLVITNNMVIGSTVTGSSQHIGDFALREIGSGAGDTAVYTTNGQGGSSDKIWTGVIGSPSLTVVAGTTPDVEGTGVCNEGAYSGEICGVEITNTNTCVTYTSFRYTCHLVAASTQTKCGGTCPATQNGDSGGPVIKYNSSGDALAAGIVSGRWGDEVPCQFNVTRCYSGLYYVPISWALNGSGLGATLRTS